MKHVIGGSKLARAQLEICSEEHQVTTGPYDLSLTLPDSSLVISGISRRELEDLRVLAESVLHNSSSRVRWDGQSGG